MRKENFELECKTDSLLYCYLDDNHCGDLQCKTDVRLVAVMEDSRFVENPSRSL